MWQGTNGMIKKEQGRTEDNGGNALSSRRKTGLEENRLHHKVTMAPGSLKDNHR